MSLCVNGRGFNLAALHLYMPGWRAEVNDDHVLLSVTFVHTTCEARRAAAVEAATRDHWARKHEADVLRAAAPPTNLEEKITVDGVITNHEQRMHELLRGKFTFQSHNELQTYKLPFGRFVEFDRLWAIASREPITTGQPTTQLTRPVEEVCDLHLAAVESAEPPVDRATLPIGTLTVRATAAARPPPQNDGGDAAVVFELSDPNRSVVAKDECVFKVQPKHTGLSCAVRVGIRAYYVFDKTMCHIGRDGHVAYGFTFGSEKVRLHTAGSALYAIAPAGNTGASHLFKWQDPEFVFVRNLPRMEMCAMWEKGMCLLADGRVFVIEHAHNNYAGLCNVVSMIPEDAIGGIGGPTYVVAALFATPTGPRMIVRERLSSVDYHLHMRVFRNGEWNKGFNVAVQCGPAESEDHFVTHVWHDAATDTTYVGGTFHVAFRENNAWPCPPVALGRYLPVTTW